MKGNLVGGYLGMGSKGMETHAPVVQEARQVISLLRV